MPFPLLYVTWIGPCSLFDLEIILKLLTLQAIGRTSWKRDLSTGSSLPTQEKTGQLRTYEGVSKSFRTFSPERELQMVQLSANTCSCGAILWVRLMSFAAITLCVASQRVFIVVVVVDFVIDPVRKPLDTPSYIHAQSETWTHDLRALDREATVTNNFTVIIYSYSDIPQHSLHNYNYWNTVLKKQFIYRKSSSSSFSFLMPFSGVGFSFYLWHLVGLLGWGISPAPRPLPTQDNTNTENRRHTSMPRAGFEPVIPLFERPKTVIDLDRASIETIYRKWIT
jgi:hypothetical protein